MNKTTDRKVSTTKDQGQHSSVESPSGADSKIGKLATVAEFTDGLGKPHEVAYLQAGMPLILIDTSAHWGRRFLGSVREKAELQAMVDDYVSIAQEFTEPYSRPVRRIDLVSRGDGEGDE